MYSLADITKASPSGFLYVANGYAFSAFFVARLSDPEARLIRKPGGVDDWFDALPTQSAARMLARFQRAADACERLDVLEVETTGLSDTQFTDGTRVQTAAYAALVRRGDVLAGFWETSGAGMARFYYVAVIRNGKVVAVLAASR